MNQRAKTVRFRLATSDRALIDVVDGGSVTYWTAKLRCSWPQLRHAVKQVGGDSEKVSAFLTRVCPAVCEGPV
jgi:hypothetical protein